MTKQAESQCTFITKAQNIAIFSRVSIAQVHSAMRKIYPFPFPFNFQFVVLFSAAGAYLPPGGRWIQNCQTPKAILKTDEERGQSSNGR